MHQIDTYNEAVAFLPAVREQSHQVTQEVVFRIETRKPGSMTVKPVNNYLKTEEEIETEFCYLDVLKMNKDGYSNIHSLDNITISGTMEENY